MRCHICDSALSEPRFNAQIDGYEPCETCLIVINDTIAGYEDRPFVSEDDLVDLPLFSYWAEVLSVPSANTEEIE